MPLLTGFTTSDAVQAFWPAVSDEFPEPVLVDQINFYILRAEYLINRAGSLLPNKEGFADAMQLATNILVRRLIWSDNHPAAIGEAAGLSSESVQGLSYALSANRSKDRSQSTTRLPVQLLGAEVFSIISDFIDPSTVMGLVKTTVFDEPRMHRVDNNGTRDNVFIPHVDDTYSKSGHRGVRYGRLKGNA